VFLPDREYGLALDALVKGCADVLVTSVGAEGLKILLGRRCVEPQPDWWFVGGRTRPGDTPEEGAARNVKRELGLALPTSRFRVVGSYSFVWRMRQQAPATNGTADVSTVLELRLGRDEASSIQVDSFAKSEYRDAKWLDPLEILQGDFNPALQQAVRDLLAMHVFDDLRAAKDGPACLVAALARRLVAWYESTPTTGPVKVVYDERLETYAFLDADQKPVPRPTKPAPPVGSSWRSLLTPRLVFDALIGPLLGAALVLVVTRRR